MGTVRSAVRSAEKQIFGGMGFGVGFEAAQVKLDMLSLLVVEYQYYTVSDIFRTDYIEYVK